MDRRAIERGRPGGLSLVCARAVARLAALAPALVLAALVLAALILPPAGVLAAEPDRPLPAGDATLTYQLRSLQTDDPAFPDVVDHDFGLFATQEIPNYGFLRLEGHLFDATGDSPERGWTQIALTDVKVGGTFVTAALGNTEVSGALLTRRLLSTIDPFFEIEGGRLSVQRGATTVGLFGGRVVDRAGSFATAVERREQDVAGLHVTQRLAPRVTLSALYLHTDGSGADPLTDLVRRNDAVGLGADVGIAGPLALVGEVRYVDEAGLASRGEKARGLSYLLGPVVERPGLRMEATLFALDRAYVPVEGATQTGDRRGLFAGAFWDATRVLGLFGSAQRSRNNLAGNPAQTTTERTQVIAGGRITLPMDWPLTLVARGERTTIESMPGQPDDVDSTSTSVVLDVSQVVGPFRPLLRSRWSRLDDDALVASSTTLDVSAELWWQVTRRSRAWLVAQWLDVSGEAGLGDMTRHLGRAGGEQRITSNLFVRGEAEVARAEEAGVETTRTGLGASLSYRHPWFDLYVDARRDWSESSADGALTPTQDAIYLRVAVPFRWGVPTPPPIGRAAGAAPNGWGAIAGEVFADLDGDGRRGPGEPGLEGLRVVLDGLVGEAAQTDAEGRYRFSRVATGPHSVRLEVRRLPADYDLVSAQIREVVVDRRGTSVADFVVQPLGRIEGRVARHLRNGDGSTRTVLPAGSLSLFLTRDDQIWQTFTDDTGEFSFDNVRAGTYQVRLDPSAVPPTAGSEPAWRTVTLAVGETANGVDFEVVQPVRREIRNGDRPPAPRAPAAPAPAGRAPATRAPATQARAARPAAAPTGAAPAAAARAPAPRATAARGRDCVGDSPEPGMPGVFRFGVDSHALQDAAALRPHFDRWARWLSEDPTRQVLVEGHTDRRADDPHNFALGARRALAVYRALADAGAPERQMRLVPEGPDLPCDPGDGEQAYAANRRVLIIIGAGR